jgi:hypothetical protein
MRALVSGSIVTEPQTRRTAKGAEYATLHLRSDGGPEPVLVSVAGFGDHAPELMKLRKADSASISGPAQLRRWRGRDGAECFGLSIVVEQLSTRRNQKRADRPDAQRKPRRPRLSLPQSKASNEPLTNDEVGDLFTDGNSGAAK